MGFLGVSGSFLGVSSSFPLSSPGLSWVERVEIWGRGGPGVVEGLTRAGLGLGLGPSAQPTTPLRG